MNLRLFYCAQLKKGHWKASFLASIAMLGSVTSIGQVSSAVVGVGSLLPFNYTKVVSISVQFDVPQAEE